MRKVDLLEKMSNRDLLSLADALQEQRFGPGQVIVQEGDSSSEQLFYIIHDGTVAISSLDDDGQVPDDAAPIP